MSDDYLVVRFTPEGLKIARNVHFWPVYLKSIIGNTRILNNCRISCNFCVSSYYIHRCSISVNGVLGI